MRFPFLWRHGRMTADKARQYVQRELGDRLGLFHGPFQLERFPQGTNPGVFKLSWNEAPPLVIRFHRAGREAETERFFRMNQYLGGLGFPIPEIVQADRTPATLRRWGAQVSLEHFIQGRPLREGLLEDEAVVRGLARLMARFHAVTHPEAGLPWQPDPRGAFAVLSERIEHFLAKARRAGLIEDAEAHAILDWFHAWRTTLDCVRPCNLIHGDLNWGNVLIEPSGRVTVIDFVMTHFGYFELDLAASARSLVGDSARAGEVFFEEYFTAAGPAARARYAAHEPFFRAFVALDKAASNAVKSGKVGRGEKLARKPYLEKSHRFLAQLREITANDFK